MVRPEGLWWRSSCLLIFERVAVAEPFPVAAWCVDDEPFVTAFLGFVELR